MAQPCEDGYPAGKGGYGQKAGRRHRRTGPVDGNESKRHDGGALRDDGDEEGRIDGFFGKRAARSIQHPHGNECGVAAMQVPSPLRNAPGPFDRPLNPATIIAVWEGARPAMTGMSTT